MTTIQQLKDTVRTGREAFRLTDSAAWLQHYRKDKPLTTEQRRQVMADVHRLFDETENVLRTDYPALTDEDVELCLLSALRYSNSAVADCLAVSEEAVRVRKHRMKGKLPHEAVGAFWEERAGTRLLRTLFVRDSMRNVWRRFPLAVVWLVLLTAFCLRMCWQTKPFTEKEIGVLIYGLAMGVVLCTTLRLWGEEVRRSALKRGVTVVANLLLVGYIVYLYTRPEKELLTADRIAMVALATALGVTFFYCSFFREKDDLPVWNFTWRTFLWFCISFLTGGILTAGVLALIRSFKWLFNLHVDEPWYATLTIITLLAVPVLLFLARIPEGEEKRDGVAVVSKYLIFVIRYLFVPLMALYLIVLYVYGFRILIRWELPNGGVGVLVSALMAGCVVVELGLYPLMRSGEAKPFERWTLRWLPVLILPLLLLMTIGIGRRLSDYGITPLRLYLLTFNVWCYAVCIGLFVGRARRIRWIMTSLATVFLLTSVLPVNYTSVSLRVRRHKLDRLVENALPDSLPMDHETLGSFLATLDKPTRKQVWDELDFLLDTDPRRVADLTTVKSMYNFESSDDGEDEILTLDYSVNSPFALPEGYAWFHDEGTTYIEDVPQVTPEGFWIKRQNGDKSAKIPLFIGKKELLSCRKDDEERAPLLCYSADSTYVLVVTHFYLRMKPDNTPISGTAYGYLLSK